MFPPFFLLNKYKITIIAAFQVKKKKKIKKKKNILRQASLAKSSQV